MTGPRRELHGVLVVDKPADVTSAELVDEVKDRLGRNHVGHTGTLDPIATGVLPLCFGEATKLAGLLLSDDKEYEGALTLGVETDTLDRDGAVVGERPQAAAAIDRDTLVRAMAGFLGAQEQTPPMFSAVRLDGRRLHDLARNGRDVERAARAIVIERFEVIAFEPPQVRFAVRCSKGTFIRSLVADLGRVLGCGAHTTSLRRTRSGLFRIDQALKRTEINEENVFMALIAPADAVPFPRLVAVPALIGSFRNGKRMPWTEVSAQPAPDGMVSVVTPAGDLLALVWVDAGRLRYERVFTYGLTDGAVSTNLSPSRAQ